MAQHMIGDPRGFTDKQRATAGSAAKSNKSVATPNNYADITSMDARLTAISATTYSQANLDRMTFNDKVYALRLIDDTSTF